MSANKTNLTQGRLKALMSYDPLTGNFTRTVNRSTAKVGDIAGYATHYGYIVIKVDGEKFWAHRLAFLYINGEFPKECVDHINRIKNDNRWVNLREGNHAQNQGNSPIQKNNTSGYKGVSWNVGSRKWQASICVKLKKKFLGYHVCKHEAAKAYNTAATKHFGKYAYLNEVIYDR